VLEEMATAQDQSCLQSARNGDVEGEMLKSHTTTSAHILTHNVAKRGPTGI
jgi:hypothetical protein